MLGVVAHAGPASPGHVLADAAVGVGVGVVLVGLYMLVLRYYVGGGQRGTD